MLIGGVALGLVLGLLLGGRLDRLADIRLAWMPLLFGAVVIRFATETLLGMGMGPVETLRLPLFLLAYGLLLYALWHNRLYPGLGLAFVGVLMNAIAIAANGGYMPIWEPSLEMAGLTRAQITSQFHVILPTQPGGELAGIEFLLRAGPLADVVPIPMFVDGLRNVASIGDLIITAGLAFFLFATLMRTPEETAQAIDDVRTGRYLGLAGTARVRRDRRVRVGEDGGIGIRSGTGLGGGLAEASALERPLLGAGAGMASPALAPLLREVDADAEADDEPADGLADDEGVPYAPAGRMAAAAAGAGAGAPALALPIPTPIAVPARPSILDRARSHPYVRLALNGSFSALWMGQLISLFGDRIHQIALAFLVYGMTGSPLAVGLVFVAATLPNLFLSPIAGTFVDRWDHREVLIVSDLLRAAAVLLIPVVVVINVGLVYPLVFLITTISIFFRPARVAILPRIVRREDLLPANSALWVGETLADVIGYPLAGLFVAFLATSLPLAFWFDAVTYVVSALLMAAIAAPPIVRSVHRARAARDVTSAADAADAVDAAEAAGDHAHDPEPSILADMRIGWSFLRHETVLLANTFQGAAGQFAIGIVTALAPVYAVQVLRTALDPTTAYAFLETAVGVGNLVGGLALGLVAARFARGRLVIFGYTFFGACVLALGLVGDLGLALGLMLGVGVANMIFVIPSQTLFQERTPQDLIGRVVGFRFALVYGSMTIAMAVGGVVAEFVGPAAVISAAGLLAMVAGLAGLAVREVREA